MFSATKIFVGLAVAGLVAVGGSAFTAAGMTTSGAEVDAQFVGGTVNQTVTGAVLTSVVYGFSDSTKTTITSAALEFDGADGKTVEVAFNGGSGSVFTCTAVAVGGASACSTVGAGHTGLTDLDVTVS